MISEAAVATMRKMAKHSRGPSAHRGMTAGRAWRQSLPKSAEEYLQLIASVKAFETEVMPLDDLVAELREDQLVATLVNGRSLPGLMVMDLALLSSLIEVQTVGNVFTSDPAQRAPSDTDLALVDHVVNRWLADQERALAAGGTVAPYKGFRTGVRLEDARAVSLSLDEGDYVVNRVTMDLALGARLGHLFLAYPKDAASDSESDEMERQQIEGTKARIMASSAELTAVLMRMKLPLSQVEALAAESLLPLPRSVIGQVQLEDLEGRKVAQARLGQSGGFRAVLLTEEVDEDAPPLAPDGLALPGPDGGGAGMPALNSADDLPGLGGAAEMDFGGDLPPLGDSADGVPEIDMGDGLPPLGDVAGDLPPLDIDDGDLPDLPPLDIGDGELPPLE